MPFFAVILIYIAYFSISLHFFSCFYLQKEILSCVSWNIFMKYLHENFNTHNVHRINFIYASMEYERKDSKKNFAGAVAEKCSNQKNVLWQTNRDFSATNNNRNLNGFMQQINYKLVLVFLANRTNCTNWCVQNITRKSYDSQPSWTFCLFTDALCLTVESCAYAHFW